MNTGAGERERGGIRDIRVYTGVRERGALSSIFREWKEEDGDDVHMHMYVYVRD